MTGFYSSLYHFIKIKQNKTTNVYVNKPSRIGLSKAVSCLETQSGNKKCRETTPLAIPLGRFASHRYRTDSPTQYGSVFRRILLCRAAEMILCRPFWVNTMLFQ